jgi:hypothetical protein
MTAGISRLRLGGIKGRATVVAFSVRASRLQERLRTKPFHQWTLPSGRLWLLFYRIDAFYLLRFPDLADFQVSADGLSVTCFPAPDVSQTTTEHLFLNQVLPLALSRLGNLAFHASAVEVAGGAVAFVAASGQGKSTLAASFATGGYRFFTDDGLVLEPVIDGYHVLPSHPSIRLWEDSRQMLIDRDAATAPPLHFTPKVRFLAGVGLVHCNEPRPLLRSYFLGDGRAQQITFRRLSGSEPLVAWIKHSFLLDVEDPAMLGPHFDRVAELANRIPCYYLDYPRRFEDLGCLRDAIVAHEISEA